MQTKYWLRSFILLMTVSGGVVACKNNTASRSLDGDKAGRCDKFQREVDALVSELELAKLSASSQASLIKDCTQNEGKWNADKRGCECKRGEFLYNSFDIRSWCVTGRPSPSPTLSASTTPSLATTPNASATPAATQVFEEECNAAGGSVGGGSCFCVDGTQLQRPFRGTCNDIMSAVNACRKASGEYDQTADLCKCGPPDNNSFKPNSTGTCSNGLGLTQRTDALSTNDDQAAPQRQPTAGDESGLNLVDEKPKRSLEEINQLLEKAKANLDSCFANGSNATTDAARCSSQKGVIAKLHQTCGCYQRGKNEPLFSIADESQCATSKECPFSPDRWQEGVDGICRPYFKCNKATEYLTVLNECKRRKPTPVATPKPCKADEYRNDLGECRDIITFEGKYNGGDADRDGIQNGIDKCPDTPVDTEVVDSGARIGCTKT